MHLGTYNNPIATICHNDDDHKDENHRKVAFWIQDGRLVAQAEDDEEEHEVECPEVTHIEEALDYLKQSYGATEWDLKFFANK